MWVVQTLTEFDGWLCTWGITGADGIRRPDMYETEAEAWAEMVESLRDFPDQELRVVKCKRFTVFATITTEYQKEFWAADKHEAKMLGDHEMTVIEPERRLGLRQFQFRDLGRRVRRRRRVRHVVRGTRSPTHGHGLRNFNGEASCSARC